MKNTKLEISLEDLKLNSDGAYFLYQASGWAKFISIVGFVMYGLVILMFLFTAIGMSSVRELMTSGYMQNPMMPYNPAEIFGWGFFAMMAIIMGVMCIPLVYLYNFSTRIKKAFNTNDTQTLAQGLRALKNLFVFYGIVIIIYLAIFFIALLIGIIAASFVM